MPTRTFIDQLKQPVNLASPIQRIVSLVPSQTELLHDLSLGGRVVGITKFCVHPKEWHQTKTIVGGTKKFNLDVIDKLEPDLIIGNKEENYQEGIDSLRSKYSVWMSDIYTITDAMNMIQSIGEMTDCIPAVTRIIQEIDRAFNGFPITNQRRVLYLIWREPWMTVGTNTFIHSVLEMIGWKNVIQDARYPELTVSEIRQLSPEIILLPSEPFPFKEIHQQELQQIVPGAKVILVDGEMFSWYGSRLVKAATYFKDVIGKIS